MTRPSRRRSTSGYHHVMNRGVDHQPIFLSDADRFDFGRQLGVMHERSGVETVAYCLMNNHFHLVLHDPADELSSAMQRFGTAVAARTNTRNGRDGALFRGRFHSIPVETDTYLMWVVRYLHRNPLAIHGVLRPRDYRWSSYRAYLGLRPEPSFLATGLVRDLFGSDIQRLARFTEDDSPRIGFEAATFRDLAQLVRFELRSDELHHNAHATSQTWKERTVLVLLAHEHVDSDIANVVARHLAWPNRSARRKALNRAIARSERDPSIRRVVERLSRRFSQRPAA